MQAQSLPSSVKPKVTVPVKPKATSPTKVKTVYVVKSNDRDGDGLSDAIDDCPDEKGSPKNNGCPEKTIMEKNNDRDGDGLTDAIDECPDEKGSPQNNGCPVKSVFQKEKTLKEVLRLVMPGKTGFNGASVVWHKKLQLYYAAFAGNETYPLVLFYSSGKQVLEFETGFDVRGLWYDSDLDKLCGNAYNGNGLYFYKLTPNGSIDKIETISKVSKTPNVQSSAAYYPDKKKILYYDDGNVNFCDAKTSQTDYSIHLSISANSVYNKSTLIYTGLKQAEIGLLNTTKSQVELYNAENGELKALWHLPKNAPVKDLLNIAYANGIVWLFDTESRSWIGYN